MMDIVSRSCGRPVSVNSLCHWSDMDGADLYVHDARLLRAVEDTATDTLTMEVDLPRDEWSDELVPRLLVFSDAYGYQVCEGRSRGAPRSSA